VIIVKGKERRYLDLSPVDLLSQAFTCKECENQKKKFQSSRFLGQNLKPVLEEYQLQVLPFYGDIPEAIIILADLRAVKYHLE
jgi:translation initiation factor 2 beta subunit (eIF-2beta)/eIF-5